MTSAYISSALATSVRSTPGGVGSAVGPLTSDTRAPSRAAAAATAYPIFPVLWLVRKRTGSRASRVGPAVTSTSTPASAPPSNRAMTRAAISSGSSIRPGPTSPHAWSPSPGPSISTPRSSSANTFARVAPACHICRFIAGASTSGAVVARHRVVRRSSASPCASRASTLAVAGATSTMSAHRASSMCPIPASACSSSSSQCTGLEESAWNVSGVTNSRAAAVITTRTSHSRTRNRRTRSAAL